MLDEESGMGHRSIFPKPRIIDPTIKASHLSPSEHEQHLVLLRIAQHEMKSRHVSSDLLSRAVRAFWMCSEKIEST